MSTSPPRYRSDRRHSSGCLIAAIAGGCLGLLLLSILVLAALLFPVFAKAREKARQASCMANVKHQSLAMLAYAADYDMHLPPATGDDYRGFVEQYADPQVTMTSGIGIWSCPTTVALPASYQFNVELSAMDAVAVTSPADGVMIFEGSSQTELFYPHNGSMNVGFVDGHVGAKSGTDVPNLTWHFDPPEEPKPDASPPKPGAAPAGWR